MLGRCSVPKQVSGAFQEVSGTFVAAGKKIAEKMQIEGTKKKNFSHGSNLRPLGSEASALPVVQMRKTYSRFATSIKLKWCWVLKSES